MKKKTCSLFKTMLPMFLLLAVTVGYAQEGRIKVNIPFAFNVGAQRFSAGEYSLTPLLQHTFQLRNQWGEFVTGFAGNSVEAPKPTTAPTLVFNRYQQRYFLSQIWPAGETTGQQLLRSSSETEVAQAMESPGQQVALNIIPSH
jgi:hypothetical protein